MKTLTDHSNRIAGRNHADETLTDLMQSLARHHSPADIRQYVERRIGGLLRLADVELVSTGENDTPLKLRFGLEQLSAASRIAVTQSVETILGDLKSTTADSVPQQKAKAISKVKLVSSAVDQAVEQPKKETASGLSAISLTTDVASSLAHKLRNYLAAIISAGEQLEETVSGNDNDDSAELSRLISRAAQDQRVLIERFLQAFGPVKVRTQEVNLDQFIRSALEQQRQRHGFNINCDGSDTELIGVTDPDLLGKIIVELAANAAEVAPQSCSTVHWHARNGRLVIRVSNDNAVGPDEMYGTYLRPFFTSKPGHTGLGLNIALRSAEALGGTVRPILLQDRTTMTVSIPFQFEDSTNSHTERNS